MKYIIVIGDGMADNPVPALGGKTPLEAASIPTLDTLAAKGKTGSALTVPHGVAPGSDTAILNIMGYDPRKYYSGRSPLEAAGCGVVLKAGEVSYRCNMVALEDADVPYEQKKILSHSGGSIEGDSSIELLQRLLADTRFAAVAEKNGMRFVPTPSFRHIAIQTGVDITGLRAEPPHDHLGEVIAPHLPQGGQAAAGLREMMEIAHEVLDGDPVNQQRRKEGKLPANGIWFWAEGTGVALPSFEQQHGKTGFVVSAVPLVHGIAALAGLASVEVEGATGELDTNYEGKAAAVVAGLQEGYDFAVLHVEAPDECTHNGDLPGKLQAIEWLDARTIAPLLAGLDKNGEAYRVLVLSDHKTLTSTRSHDGDPVPYVLYDSRQDAQGTPVFSEKACEAGEFVAEGDTLVRRLLEEI